MLIKKFEYPQLSRVEVNGQRQYTLDGLNPVPSVTTILSATADKTVLIEWRKRVGDEEANRISRESAGLGTRVHGALERHIKGEQWDTFGNNLVSIMAKQMSGAMINQGLAKVDEIWGVEVGLYASELYAGTSDAVGVYDGEPAIIDFKTSKKLKPIEWIDDYFMQGVFYAEAHNSMFGTEIKKVAILMVDRENKVGTYIISGSEYERFKLMAMKRLAAYYNIQID